MIPTPARDPCLTAWRKTSDDARADWVDKPLHKCPQCERRYAAKGDSLSCARPGTMGGCKGGIGAAVEPNVEIAGVPVGALPKPAWKSLLRALTATRRALPAWREIPDINTQTGRTAQILKGGLAVQHELRLLAASSPSGEEAVRTAMRAQIPDSESDEEKE